MHAGVIACRITPCIKIEVWPRKNRTGMAQAAEETSSEEVR